MSTHVCIDCDSPGDGNCSSCHGTGTSAGASFSEYGSEGACSSCGGSGHCVKCGGSGEIEVGGEG